MANRNIIVDMNGYKLSRIWHCFGNYMHAVDLPTVLAMLDVSETNVIPVNTHNLSASGDRDDLLIGFGGVTYDTLARARDLSGFVHMLNINHQTSAEAAIAKTLLAYELLPEPVIKIEVLNSDLATANNAQLLSAVAYLRKHARHLALMPLMACSVEDAKVFIDLGCPVLRVMGTPIGAGSGISDPEAFGRICELGVPVVLDGGVGSVDHFVQACDLGAQGCLVNSMLFTQSSDPVTVLRDFVDGSYEAMTQLDAA
ncbi:MAG: hypothetical protein VR78_06580 [Hoeflea sp. BRH_c9]|nr:MAG: hypothetical protein VR78_06580 [Hoeflea sp. BRH_c9]